MEVGMKNLAAAVLAGLAIALAMPASALADAVATTDPATNVTFTSAQLNGTVNADPGSNYFFEYGARTCHDHRTQPTAVASGVQHVSAAVDNLTPGVTYCFHLVVNDILSGGGVTTHTGSDLNFTTQVPTVPATTGKYVFALPRDEVKGLSAARTRQGRRSRSSRPLTGSTAGTKGRYEGRG